LVERGDDRFLIGADGDAEPFPAGGEEIPEAGLVPVPVPAAAVLQAGDGEGGGRAGRAGRGSERREGGEAKRGEDPAKRPWNGHVHTFILLGATGRVPDAPPPGGGRRGDGKRLRRGFLRRRAQGLAQSTLTSFRIFTWKTPS